jgi:SAM-dependent methyltransferase
MKRLTGEINEPEFFNQDRYIGNLACWDVEKENKMNKYFKGGHYLSIGCLNSVVPVLLAEQGHKVTGIDFADKVLDFLRSRFPKVHYIASDIRNGIEFPSMTVDYISASELVEHLEDPKKFIDECMRVLKKGGVLSISTPYEEGVKQGAVDKHAHIWSFSEEDFKEWGFETELLKEGIQTSILAWKKK